MNCDRINQVHAYHDGELPIGQRAAVEQHLLSCSQCAMLLADLRSLSQQIAAAPMAVISPRVLDVLRGRQFIAPDAGVMRIAGWLTAAAAAVLLAALPFWPGQMQSQTPQANASVPVSLIETLAVNPPTDNAADDSHSDAIADAQWMADNFSADQQR